MQRVKVLRGFEQPALACRFTPLAFLPLQELQHFFQLGIHRPLILLIQPAGVAGHVDVGVHGAHERVFHEHELFVAEHGIERVNREDLRNDFGHQIDLGPGLGDTPGRHGQGFVWQWCRKTGFPPRSGVETRVNRQCALKHGGAGARQPHDGQRILYRYLGYFRITAQVVLHHQAVDQLRHQSFFQHMQSGGRQLGFGRQGGQQRLQ